MASVSADKFTFRSLLSEDRSYSLGMKVNDILILSGKTRRGKNRVREQGRLWKVLNIKGAMPHGPWPTGTEIAELETVDGKHWRIVSVVGDTDFDFHSTP